MSNTDPNKNWGWTHVLSKVSIPASYKTPAVLLIYTVKFDKSLVGDRGKIKNLRKKEKASPLQARMA